MVSLGNVVNLLGCKAGLQPDIAVNGYSRLKRLFTSNLNYESYDKIVLSAKNKVIGNIPDDMLKAAIKLPERAKVIKKVQSGFAQAADELNMQDKIMLDELQRNGIPDEKMDFLLKKLITGEVEELKNTMKDILDSFLPEETIQKIHKNATGKIKEAMADILPEDAEVKLSFLGGGAFGRGYRLEFLDNKGKKIFKDRVMKVYRDSEFFSYLLAEIGLKQIEMLSQMTVDELYSFFMKNNSLFRRAVGNGSEQEIKEYIEMFKTSCENIPSKDELRKGLQIIFDCQDTHGVAAEANSSAYIRNALGHSLHNTNLNKQDMFDLGHKFSISPYSDDSLPEITKEIDFSKLGIIPTDIEQNASNTVAGRVIDIGGIQKEVEELTDKIIRRYYKQVVNRKTMPEKTDIITRLKQLCENIKTPHRNKIRRAVELAEQKIINDKVS